MGHLSGRKLVKKTNLHRAIKRTCCLVALTRQAISVQKETCSLAESLTQLEKSRLQEVE